MIRIFVNNSLSQEQPKGLDSLVEEIELNKDVHGYLYQISGSITFIGLDYDYLRKLYESGYCNDVDIDIQYSEDFGNSYVSKAKGVVKLAGIKWDRIKRQAEVPIVANSFASKIYNNRQIVFQLGEYGGTVLSKNGVDVSSKFVTHSNVYFFSPFRGRYFGQEALYFKSDPPFPSSEGDDLVDLRPQPRVGMFLYDALNLIVAMMTDNEVDFASDYLTYDINDLTSANDVAASMIFSGQHLRHGSGFPKLNFEQFFNDLHKLANLYFAMEFTSAGKPRIRIEPESYFRQINSNVYFNDVKSLVESINLEKIYSNVVVGCSVSSSRNFPVGSVPLVHHVQEEFPLSGTCNVNNELNLRLEKLIINTDAISEALPPITGYANGGSVKRKYTTGQTQNATNEQLTDSNGQFKESLIEQKMLIRNTVTGEWSYITGVPTGTDILIWDQIFDIDNTGLTKDYEIYKPSEETQFFDEVFLIQLNKTLDEFDNIYAHQTEIDPPADLWYYNATFANYQVITRHLGGIAQSIVSSISDGNDQFLAQQTSNHVLNDSSYFIDVPQNANYKRIRFDDDVNSPNFDTNNNYDPLTGIYTAPQGGYYHAYCSIRFINNNIGNHDFTQQVELCKVSSDGDVIESESAYTTITEPSSYTFELDRVFYLQAGETIQVFVKKPFGLDGIWLNQYIDWDQFDGIGSYGEGYGILSTTDLTFFGVDELYNGGGLVPASTPDEVRLLDIESELTIDRDTFDLINSNPFQYYHTNIAPSTSSPQYISGYIQKISRGILDGKCTLTQFKKHLGV